MSKKITSVEELVKLGKECEKLIEVRKKWDESDLKGKIQFKVGVSSEVAEASKLADQVGIAIIDYVRANKFEDVVVYRTDFKGYSGDLPSLSIVIPDRGEVVFGNVTIEEAVKLAEKYLNNTEEIVEFLVDNDGNKKCNH